MEEITKLAEIFNKFPGIGQRQAKRFVYYLLRSPKSYSQELIRNLEILHQKIKQCPECFIFFNNPRENICENCLDKNADQSILMIVEKDTEHENIKKSGIYDGTFFILGGLIDITNKENEKRIRINELIKKIEKKKEILKEIIIALSLTPQGEHTDLYLKNKLKDLKEKYNFKISSLGRGLSTGTELEYSDTNTLKNALKNRNSDIN